jgi:hypothetical protein
MNMYQFVNSHLTLPRSQSLASTSTSKRIPMISSTLRLHIAPHHLCPAMHRQVEEVREWKEDVGGLGEPQAWSSSFGTISDTGEVFFHLLGVGRAHGTDDDFTGGR